ncbi:MAG: sodium:solute symporter, partial [Thermoguttaceae bacterium]|nr:sodium:solute symporter [Thermoguttaceae bacterium]
MTLFRPFFFLFFLLAAACFGHEGAPVNDKSGDTPQDTAACFAGFPDNEHVSQAFVGLVGGRVVIRGGKTSSGLSNRLYERKEGSRDATLTPIDLVLPQSIAGGASVNLNEGMLFLGGFDTNGPVNACRLLTRQLSGKYTWQDFPPLPVAVAHGAADRLGQFVYFAGRSDNTKTTRASSCFFVCDLSRKGSNRRWEKLPSLPFLLQGEIVAAVQEFGHGKCFILFGYTNDPLVVGSHSAAVRKNPAGKDTAPKDTAAKDTASDANGDPPFVVNAYDPETQIWITRVIPDVPSGFKPTSALATGTTHILFSTASTVPSEQGIESGNSLNLPNTSNALWAYNTITGRLFRVKQTSNQVHTGAIGGRLGNFVYAFGTAANGRSGIARIELPGRAVGLSPLNIAVMVGYFLILAGMGFYFARRQKGTDDYFKGGKRVPWWAVGLSIYGASLSAISYMAVPAKSFMSNWGLIFLSSAALWAAPFIVWFYIPRMRRYNFTSAYEYLECRYNLLTRLIGSTVFILFQIVRMAVMLFLPAIALNVVTNLDIYTCIVAMGVVSIVYTMFGGIEAVIWTDVVQVVILLAGAIGAVVIAATQIDGGVAGLLQVGFEDAKFRCIDTRFSLHTANIWVIVTASFFLYIIPFASDQTIVQRYFVGQDDRDAGRGLWVNAWVTLPGTITLFLLGTAFYVFYKSQPEALSLTMDNNDSLLPWFVITQLPDGVSGLLIVAIFAASMSSLSASMNSISAAYTFDFHERVFGFDKNHSLTVAKATTLLSGSAGVLLAVAMATWDISSFWDEYNRLMGLMSSGLAGIFVLGLISKRTNGIGAVLGLLTSFLVQLHVVNHHCVHFLLYCGTGFLTALVVGYL